jgi:DNA-binding CsgD family transcriptional regulator
MTDATLLERGDLQEAIQRALRESRHGGGQVLLIEGAAGIGKSRLLAELRLSAAAGQRVLVARASELERGFAFGVVRQLFEGIVRDPDQRDQALDGAATASLEIFEDLETAGGAASFALLHGLYWLTLNIAEQGPLVLCVDDLHWCDTSSLRFLAYLARRLEGTDILLATATRPIAPDSADAQLLGDLLEQPNVVHLFPQALSAEATRALLEDQLEGEVDPVFARACFDATDGNPLMLRQLARSLEAEGILPTAEHADSVRRAARRALSRTVLARVGRRSQEAVAVARALAVLGEGATPALVAALAEVDEPTVERTWRELFQAEVLRHDALAFVHALVRDAIYLDLPEPSRERWHLRAARALEAAGASAERIVSQLHLAPRTGDQWVAETAFQAGLDALRHGAPDAAVGHLRRALEEPIAQERRLAVLEPLAGALFNVDAPASIAVLAELAGEQDDPRASAELRIGQVQALALTDRWEEAARLCRELEGTLSAEQEDQRAMFQAIRSVCTIFGARDPEGYQLLDAYREPAGSEAMGFRMRAGQSALMWAYESATAQEAGDLAASAIQSDPTVLADHTLIAVAPLYVLALADREECMEIWEAARADAHRSGSVILHVTIGMWLGIIQHRRGDLTGAIAGLHDSLVFADRWGTGDEPRRYANTSLAMAYLDAGDLAQSRVLLSRAEPPAGARSLATLLWFHAHAWALVGEGRFQEAIDACRTLEERASTWVRQPIGFDWHLPRAVALHRLGREDEAREAAEAGLALGRHWGSPGVLGPALRVLGEVKGNDGLPELQESIAVLEGGPAAIQLARSLVQLGSTLRRTGAVTEARAPLERAYELAIACGSPGLAESARVELAASGVRRLVGDSGGAAGLTPSERRVADLAAEGRTNREIAQELFVTPKTVEVHLSAAYRKLGISSRRELAAALTPA